MEPRSERVTVRRLPKRGSYGREELHAILDEAYLCHVGFTTAAGTFVIPTAFGRNGEALYIHGSAASRMLGELPRQAEVCVCVTLVDGLVLARSAFHHSINYRSAVILGQASLVTDADEKMKALLAISENIIAGRWDEVRGPNAKELKATSVVRITTSEFSVKTRSGPPVDDEEDYALPMWAGVLPLETRPGTPRADERVAPGTPVSDSVKNYARGKKR